MYTVVLDPRQKVFIRKYGIAEYIFFIKIESFLLYINKLIHK